MVVIKAMMWPGGSPGMEYPLSIATLTCTGHAPETGERCYEVRLLKGHRFGGPGPDDVERIRQPKSRDVWRSFVVRGHFPARRGGQARGLWDLLGGALKVGLGFRLNSYQPSPSESKAKGRR